MAVFLSDFPLSRFCLQEILDAYFELFPFCFSCLFILFQSPTQCLILKRECLLKKWVNKNFLKNLQFRIYWPQENVVIHDIKRNIFYRVQCWHFKSSKYYKWNLFLPPFILKMIVLGIYKWNRSTIYSNVPFKSPFTEQTTVNNEYATDLMIWDNLAISPKPLYAINIWVFLEENRLLSSFQIQLICILCWN